MTIVPLKIFFNDRGRAKIEIAVARGKQLHDKRETEKQRDWNREKSRLLTRAQLVAALGGGARRGDDGSNMAGVRTPVFVL